jgi:uncharacterized damage-inducible protein DinB
VTLIPPRQRYYRTVPAPTPEAQMNTLHEALDLLFRFDAWANRTVASALAREGVPGQAEAARLFAHLTRASEVWLGRVQRSPAAALPVWPEGPDADLAASAARAEATASAWRDHLREAPDLSVPIAYVNTRGEAFETPLGEIALHVTHHGTHHRAQISRVLREGGVPPPALDLIAFVRSPER